VKVKVANKKYFCKRKRHSTTFSSIHLAKTKLFLNFAPNRWQRLGYNALQQGFGESTSVTYRIINKRLLLFGIASRT